MKKNYFILLFVFTAFFSTNKASAQQIEVFLGQIIMFGGNYAPQGWALCNGQEISIQQNQALFAILGTTYGGDGVNTFGLPDLRSRVPVGQGQGPGLTTRIVGEKGGTENTNILVSNLPPHTHSLNASTLAGNTNVPTGKYLANTSSLDKEYIDTTNTTMHPTAVGVTGSGVPISIVQPYIGINYIISLNGVWPARP